jgi:large subunit ribosomal protein L30
MAKKAAPKNELRITLKKSGIGYTKRQKNTLKALGLHDINQTITQVDNPAVRGMIAKVSHLVEIETEA